MQSLFTRPGTLIGMIHAGALPGTPGNTTSLEEIAEAAVSEARALEKAGFEALIVENMHDRPYLLRQVGPEIVASMTVVCRAVRDSSSLPLGVQVLAGANEAALAIALATGAAFIRAEGFAYSAVADEGLFVEADAGPLLRYRRAIGANDIQVVCDVKKKHSAHAITADASIAEIARGSEFAGADGVVVTGASTGRATDPREVEEVARSVRIPTLVGSGVTPENVPDLISHAAGFIVGSYIKHDEDWRESIDERRCRELVEAVRAERARLD